MPRDAFYASPQWVLLRRTVLAGHPQCSHPGCRRPGRHLDHVIPRRARPDLALDPGNLRPLCHSHHSSKTASRDGGWGNPIDPNRLHRGADAAGNPTDPRHHWHRT